MAFYLLPDLYVESMGNFAQALAYCVACQMLAGDSWRDARLIHDLKWDEDKEGELMWCAESSVTPEETMTLQS